MRRDGIRLTARRVGIWDGVSAIHRCQIPRAPGHVVDGAVGEGRVGHEGGGDVEVAALEVDIRGGVCVFLEFAVSARTREFSAQARVNQIGNVPKAAHADLPEPPAAIPGDTGAEDTGLVAFVEVLVENKT